MIVNNIYCRIFKDNEENWKVHSKLKCLFIYCYDKNTIKLISKCCTVLQLITIVRIQRKLKKTIKRKKAPDMVLYKMYKGIIIDSKTSLYILLLLYYFRAYKHSNYHNLEYRYASKYIV